MKYIIFLLGCLINLCVYNAHSQSKIKYLPDTTTVAPYQLEVGYNTTTLLVFPAPVLDGDRGFNQIIAQKEKNVSNVLKVKGTQRNFAPTNLHVYTGDGKLYSFNVVYVDTPYRLTFDLSKIPLTEMQNSPLTIANPVSDDSYIKKIADYIRTSKPFFRKKADQDYMRLRLQGIYCVKDQIWFSFLLANPSNLRYDLDFVRFYIKDKKIAKRSSIQEREILPVYTDRVSMIGGKDQQRITIAVPKFTIPNNKEFFVEVFEKNGGRNVTLKLKNKHLLRAKSL
jgi:conjugative transposon TraN protein